MNSLKLYEIMRPSSEKIRSMRNSRGRIENPSREIENSALPAEIQTLSEVIVYNYFKFFIEVCTGISKILKNTAFGDLKFRC